MQQFCQYGSVRGATGNRRPYRDNTYTPMLETRHFLQAHTILEETRAVHSNPSMSLSGVVCE